MPDVLYEVKEGGVAWITLNRPDSLNAMGGELMPLLGKHLADCAANDEVRCVVLTGAGLSLALACDIRIASENAKMGTVFRNVGFSGDFGGSWFLPRLVGIEQARRLYFTGEVLDAHRAKNIGLVSQIVPHDDLEKETMALASHLASGPTLAYARMKENLNRSASVDLATLLDQEALNMILSSTTQDHQEAAKAFVEKRKPAFVGQ